MFDFNKRILFVGYGAVAECTLPIIFKHINVPAANITVMDFEDRAAKLAEWTAKGVRFAPGGIRKGAAGFDITFLHPKANEEFPIGGEGVLIELVQAPQEVVQAFAALAAQPV